MSQVGRAQFAVLAAYRCVAQYDQSAPSSPHISRLSHRLLGFCTHQSAPGPEFIVFGCVAADHALSSLFPIQQHHIVQLYLDICRASFVAAVPHCQLFAEHAHIEFAEISIPCPPPLRK